MPFLFLDGFNLPLKSSLEPPGTFQAVMDTLREAATLSILERLHNVPQGRYTHEFIDKMHWAVQDLMYFRNVDGSFSDPLVVSPPFG